MSQATFALQGHNPDVLTCIANLSNDEVFTPPEFANQMLDTLAQSWANSNDGENIWSNKEVTFLDPCTKSGVFLREIVRRLNEGLARELPDLTERINHILTKQVFGIGITELTSLLARRTVYCSKNANGIHSIARTFTNGDGNVWFERTEHSWGGTKCNFCAASKSEYLRNKDLETHAYAFIHSENIKNQLSKMFGDNMRFDVIIGNPPYQLSNGESSDIPIYQHFVTQAKALEPRFLSMIIPSRWMAGGKGLDSFRKEMLGDKRIRFIEDYPNAWDVFPSVEIQSGVCYFLWNRDNPGLCQTILKRDGLSLIMDSRDLNEFDVLVRDARAVSILRKVLQVSETPVEEIVSGQTPFGLLSNFKGYRQGSKQTGDLKRHLIENQKRVEKWVAPKEVGKGLDLVPKFKVFVPKAYNGGPRMPHRIIGPAFVGESGSVCTQSYLAVGPFDSQLAADSLLTYMNTRFFRFLLSLRKISQDAMRATYRWVPQQSWDQVWTDKDLYKKYKLTKDEIAFIESMIRPMELDNE
jgi:site-specific DNA-methyltransferase (adenine-specific)